MINFTEIALERVREVLSKQNCLGLRIGVRGGGCSGLEYVVEVIMSSKPLDKIFEFGETKIFIDPKSYIYLNGLTVDYSDELLNSGFRFNNPGAKTCSCGISFNKNITP
mgnify:CR=1 FL=1